MASDNNLSPSTSHKRKSMVPITDSSAIKKLRSSSRLSAAEQIDLLHLNDDCLEPILRHLSLADLNDIGATCHRLHDIAATIYRHHSPLKSFDIRTMAERFGLHKKWSDPDVIKCFEAYLQRFGHLIENIDFIAGADELPHRGAITNIFKLMSRYCSTGLKSLKTRSIEVDLRSKSVLLPILALLTKLNVDNGINWPKLLPMCVNLVELSIDYNNNSRSFNLNGTLSQLKSFKLDCKSTLHIAKQPQLCTQLAQFLNDHPNLAVLSLKAQPVFLVAMADCLNNLQELELHLTCDGKSAVIVNMEPLYHLSKLHKITIKCFRRMNFSGFLKQTASAQTLQYLAIDGVVINQQFIEGLSRCNQLRHWKLSRVKIVPVPDAIWTKMRKLQNLKELDLCDVHDATAIKILRSLTAAEQSLQSLSIGPKVGLDSVAPFVNLRFLAMPKNANDFKSALQSLQRLNQINQLIVINDYDRPRIRAVNLLNSFGSLRSLEKLEIHDVTVTMGLITKIASCGQLKQLKLLETVGFTAEHLNVLASLQRIEELVIHVDYECCPPDGHAILDLVQKCPSLKSMSLRGFCYTIEDYPSALRAYDFEADSVDGEDSEDEFGEDQSTDDEFDDDEFDDYEFDEDDEYDENEFRDYYVGDDITFIPNTNEFYEKLLEIVQGRKNYCKLVLNIKADFSEIPREQYEKGRKFVELQDYRKWQRTQKK